ncbi:MAG: glycosyltransferase family 39 protein [Tepidisphaerales bacterium]
MNTAPTIQSSSPKTPIPLRATRPEIALLALILIGAAAVRIHNLGIPSLWLDELFTIASSTGHYPDQRPLRLNVLMDQPPNMASLAQAKPWWQIWQTMRDGVHPPVYILAVRGWRHLFGEGDAAARSLSVAASLGAVLLVYLAGRMLGGPATGLWAAALLGAAWVQIEYAREARPYALLLMFGTGAMLALLRIERMGSNRPRMLALGCCVLAMALTHYFSFGALVAMAAYVAIGLRGAARRRAAGAMVAAAGLFLLAWGPTLWAQRHNTQFTFLSEPPGKMHTWLTLQRMDSLPQWLVVPLGGPPLADDAGRLARITHYLRHRGIPGLGWAIYILPVFVLRRRRELLLPWLWLLGTVGFVSALDLFRATSHLVNIRYTLLAGPGLYLLLARSCELLRRPARAGDRPCPHRLGGLAYLLSAAVVCLSLWLSPAGFMEEKGDWRPYAAAIREHVGPREPLVFAGPWEPWYPQAMYMGLTQYEYQPTRPIAVLDGPADANLQTQLRAYDHISLIGGAPSDVQTYLPGWQIEQSWVTMPATLYRLKRAPMGGANPMLGTRPSLRRLGRTASAPYQGRNRLAHGASHGGKGHQLMPAPRGERTLVSPLRGWICVFPFFTHDSRRGLISIAPTGLEPRQPLATTVVESWTLRCSNHGPSFIIDSSSRLGSDQVTDSKRQELPR